MNSLNPFRAYKAFVRGNPGLVQNIERLLHWVVWNPERFSSSEFAYEGFNAAVGLLGIYNESILAEDEGSPAARWSLWLAAVEQVQMLVELRGIALEQQGKMSRYSPLVVIELIKLLLRLHIWSSSGCALMVEAADPADQEQAHQEQQLRELMAALLRLRQRYAADEDAGLPAGAAGGGGSPAAVPPGAAPAAGSPWGVSAAPIPTAEQVNAAVAVRAAAVAPGRPPAACAADLLAVPRDPGELPLLLQQQPHPQLAAGATTAQPQQQRGWLQGTGSTHSSSSGSLGSRGQGQGAWAAWRPSGWGRGGGGRSSSIPGAGGSTAAASVGFQQQQAAEGQEKHLTWQQQQQQEAPAGSSSSRWQLPWGLLRHRDQQQQPDEQHQHKQPGQQPAGSVPQLQPSRCVSFSAWAGAAGAPSGARSTAGGAGGSSKGSSGSSSRNTWRLDYQEQAIGRCVITTGEALHLLRPLVYVLLLRRYGTKSWRPWAASLGLDLLSMYGNATGKRILDTSSGQRWPPHSTLYSLALLRSLGSNKWNASEQQELLRRRLMLVKYLVRSPAYEAVVRPQLARLLGAVGWLPLMGNVSSFALSLIDGMQQYYSYVEP